MKKSKVKTILIVLIILIALILCFNIGAYAAYVLSATEVSYTKSDGTSTSVKSALDELYTKVPTHEIGDEVTVGGEQFYVLEWDNNSDMVRLISKYNLNTAGTAQQDATYSTTACAFSSSDYWTSSFTSSPFNLNDFIGFTSTDAIGKAKNYGRSKGAVACGLLSYEEAKALDTKSDSNTKVKNMVGGLDSTSGSLYYWLGSAQASHGGGVMYVKQGSNGPQTTPQKYSSIFGVRPVITILKSKIS